MTDAEYERLKNILDRWVTCWKERLKLGYWQINCYFFRTAKEFTAALPEGAVEAETGAATKAKWQYMNGSLFFNVERIGEYADAWDLEEIVCHELHHCVVDEMYRCGIAQEGGSTYEQTEWSGHNERTVTWLTANAMSAYHPKSVEGEY